MPSSKTEICNQALAHIGITKRIADIETENSKAADNCRLFFDTARDVLLEMQPWSFAEREVTLQSVGSPPTSWAYRYKYPNFCARANKIVNPNDRTPSQGKKIAFKVRDYDDAYGKVVLTDQENAVLQYNHKITDVSLYPPSFSYALSLFLASNISTPMRADPKITTTVNQLFNTWLIEAGIKPYQERQEDVEPASQFVSIRG